MAYYLEWVEPWDKYVTIPSISGAAYSSLSTVGFSVKYTTRAGRANNEIFRIVLDNGNLVYVRISNTQNGTTLIAGAGSGSRSGNTTHFSGETLDIVLLITLATNNITLTVNGIEEINDTLSGISSIKTATAASALMGTNGSTRYMLGDIHNATYFEDGVVLHNWDASASNGTGLILPDTVGNSDGVLTGFPTDDSQWVFYSDTTAIELTPTTINSNSQSFNPLIQYASLLSLAPSVVNSASSALNPVIQYSASLLLAPSVVNSASSSLNPALQYASVVLLEPNVVNSNTSALNPNISFSATLSLFPTAVNSTSSSLDPVVKYISALDLLPSAVNSNSASLDPVVNYTSILNLSPSVVNSNSVSFNPSIDYTSALILSPVTVDSSSISLDPLVEYKAVINITSQLINSASVSLNPSISTGATQDVGLVSAGFAADLYSVKYEPSGVTASYQLSNITVNFKG